MNQHVAIIRPDSTKLDPGYLRYHLASPETQALLLSWAGSGGTRNALTKGMIESLELPIPPLHQQRAIAHILGTLDDKIELNRRMNETLEEMARAIFKDWFVDFGPTRAKMEGRERYLPAEVWELFPDRLVGSEVGEVPEGWGVKRLDEIIELNPREPMKKGTTAPYLNMAALPTSGPNPNDPVMRDFTSGTRFRNNDALLARITPCLENGKTAFIQSLPDHAVGWGSTEFIVMRAIPPVPPLYTYMLARNPSFRQYAIHSMTGTSGRQRARTETLASYAVVCPTTRIWDNFASATEPMFAMINANGLRDRTLASLRDALLPKLVSGEIS